MLISQAIAQCTALTGQVVDNAVLVRWLSEIDGRLAFEFYRADAWTPYDPTDDISCELLVPFPWDGLYVHHLAAMTYFTNGEYDRYENERTMSEKKLADFRSFMQRTQAKKCGCPGFPTEKTGGSAVTVIPGNEYHGPWFWISAYALAVKHGYKGTEEEWLNSVSGPNVITEDTTTELIGVLTGNGSTVEAKALDTSSLTKDNAHIPTSGAVKNAIINQNLLDNPAFLINQRGITTEITSGTYGPDRWIVYNSQSENVSFQNGAVLPQNGSVLQRLDAVTIAALTGRTVTASALIEKNGTYDLISGTIASFSASGSDQYFEMSPKFTILATDSITRSIQFFANSACTLIAVKLEIGDTQTLAHQENGQWVLNEIPNYQQELAKCQRFFQKFRTQSLRPTYGEDFRPVMASATPTLSTISIDEVTYYTASSEL